ncbi:hypothetical protein HDV62DRAFT_294311 [Trichoderma sp. SZMC 28011]
MSEWVDSPVWTVQRQTYEYRHSTPTASSYACASRVRPDELLVGSRILRAHTRLAMQSLLYRIDRPQRSLLPAVGSALHGSPIKSECDAPMGHSSRWRPPPDRLCPPPLKLLVSKPSAAITFGERRLYQALSF